MSPDKKDMEARQEAEEILAAAETAAPAPKKPAAKKAPAKKAAAKPAEPVEPAEPAEDEEAQTSASDEGDESREPTGEKTPEEKLNDLIERGKKAGKLTPKDLEGIEQWGLEPDAIDKFYENLEAAGVDIDIGDDALPPWRRTSCRP